MKPQKQANLSHNGQKIKDFDQIRSIGDILPNPLGAKMIFPRLENLSPKRPNSQSKIGLNSGQKWPQTD